MTRNFQDVGHNSKIDANEGQGRTALSATTRWAANSLEG